MFLQFLPYDSRKAFKSDNIDARKPNNNNRNTNIGV